MLRADMRFSPRQKLTVMSFASLSAVLALTLIFGALAGRVLASRNKLAEIQASIHMREERRAGAKTLAATLGARQADIARIRSFFIDPVRPLGFIEALEELGRRTDTAVAIDVNEQKRDAAHLGFRITLEGTEESLITMARLIELLPYDVSMEEFMFQRLSPDAAGQIPAPVRLFVGVRVRTR